MREFYVTFGQKYRTEKHPYFPNAHPDGYVVIEAKNYASACEIANEKLGMKYAFVYRDKPNQDVYPFGELGRF